ncbi:MAG: fibronectin type III domain-containing protein [Longimicrobiaceae bacterium]
MANAYVSPGAKAIRRTGAAALLAAAAGLAACGGDLGTGAPARAPRGPAAEIFPGGFETDFSGYTVGAQPAGWSQAWVPSAAWSVADAPTATGGRVLRWSSVDVSRSRFALAYDGYGDLGDQAVYTEFSVGAVEPGALQAYLGAAAVRLGGTGADPHGYVLYFVDNAAAGVRSVVLATFDEGAYVQLQDLPLAWSLDTWYSVRLEAIGAQVHARVWPRGTPEPVGWPIETFDERYPTGRPGVANHDLGVVEWDVWAVDPAPPPPPPPVGSTWVATFAADAAGLPPAGWTATSAPSAVTWAVADDAAAVDGRLLRAVSSSTARHILRLDAIPDSTVHQEAFIRFRLGDGDDYGPGLALRHTMSGGAESAYVAYLRTSSGQVEIDRFDHGAWAFMAAKSFASAPGVWYRMRFGALGSALRVKVWPEGTPEPGGWTLQSNDGALAQGSAGVYVYEPNTVDVDGFSAASGGLSAPTPPVRTVVTPDPGTVTVGGTLQLSAFARTLAGDSVAAAVEWSASAGSVTSGGLFQAPSAAGPVQVTATPTDGTPAGSATVNVTLPPPPAAPGSPSATAQSSTAIDVAWTDAASTEDGYTVERAPDAAGAPGAFVLVATLAAGSTGYASTGLNPSTRYWFRVSAFNPGGSSAAAPVSAVTIAAFPPAAPSTLAALVVSGTSVRLTWRDNASNEDGVQVEQAPDVAGAPGAFAQVAATGAGATAYTVTSLTSGTRYWFRVRAFNTAGSSDYANVVSATPPTLPAAPSGLVATTSSATSIGLSWVDNSTNEIGFKLERAPDVGGAPGSWVLIGTAIAGSTGFTSGGLAPGTTYWYRVRSYNGAGNSAYSAAATATTLP